MSKKRFRVKDENVTFILLYYIKYIITLVFHLLLSFSNLSSSFSNLFCIIPLCSIELKSLFAVYLSKC